MDTVLFIAEIILLVAAVILVTVGIEKLICRKDHREPARITTKKITMVGVFAAVSGVLMILEIPLPFSLPFYKLDISEVPVLILSFAYGPVTGILCELLKILVKLVLKGTSSAFVGELANFIIGCIFVVPAGIIYIFRKSRKQAVLACVCGTILMTAAGSVLNAVYLLPKFAVIYGIPLEEIIAMGTGVNSAVSSINTLVLFCVVPVNLLKGTLDSVLTMLLYKRLSREIKGEAQR